MRAPRPPVYGMTRQRLFALLASGALTMTGGCAVRSSIHELPPENPTESANADLASDLEFLPEQTSLLNRKPASLTDCAAFNALSSAEKSRAIMREQINSLDHARITLRDRLGLVDRSSETVPSPELLFGGDAAVDYTDHFIGGVYRRAQLDVQALHATTKFLSPPIGSLGYPRLRPTFSRNCDFFENPQVKMVHAIGTLAKARMFLYSQLQPQDFQETGGSPIKNPWSGLFSHDQNPHGVPVWLRFSIANPVAHTIQVGGRSLSLEFIPGLGLKFLIDGKKSIDLVAMESLAGQGADQNYFKYPFSPDFSGHAPPKFNTSTGPDHTSIIARYDHNPVNREVMNEVGVRFFQVIPNVFPQFTTDRLNPTSITGPHPFIISIQRMAELDAQGNHFPRAGQKRPWRLIFEPAIMQIPDIARSRKIVDSTPYQPGHDETDFRSKLAHLKSGDRVFYVVAQNRDGRRYRFGEIVLSSAPLPSEFADREFFVQHDLEMGRLPENAGILAEP